MHKKLIKRLAERVRRVEDIDKVEYRDVDIRDESVEVIPAINFVEQIGIGPAQNYFNLLKKEKEIESSTYDAKCDVVRSYSFRANIIDDNRKLFGTIFPLPDPKNNIIKGADS